MLICSGLVVDALAASKPVVALETTLVTHGLPHPEGLETALALEDEVWRGGAVPATIGILRGAIRVGLDGGELNELAATGDVAKTNLSNLGAVVASGTPGSTTVAATMFAAHAAGIRVFATGGIGGVHRDVELSGDVSADLTALSRIPVAVVCAGAKAILDLPRTVEMLETLGVPVLGLRTASSRRSTGDRAACRSIVRSTALNELARAVHAHFQFRLGTGVVIANPIPSDDEMPQALYETVAGNGARRGASTMVFAVAPSRRFFSSACGADRWREPSRQHRASRGTTPVWPRSSPSRWRRTRDERPNARAVAGPGHGNGSRTRPPVAGSAQRSGGTADRAPHCRHDVSVVVAPHHPRRAHADGRLVRSRSALVHRSQEPGVAVRRRAERSPDRPGAGRAEAHPRSRRWPTSGRTSIRASPTRRCSPTGRTSSTARSRRLHQPLRHRRHLRDRACASRSSSVRARARKAVTWCRCRVSRTSSATPTIRWAGRSRRRRPAVRWARCRPTTPV